MEPAALGGIIALLLVKEAGLPIPVPGDLVVIATGAALASSAPLAAVALLLILLAGYLGGTVQYVLLRGRVRRRLLALLGRFGVSAGRVEMLAARLRGGGARGVAVSRMTPGVRVVSIAASALAGIPASAFIRGLVAGNTVFVGAHFGLGFALGASATTIIAGAAGIIGPILLGLAGLAVIGGVGWALLRRRTAPGIGQEVASWADACCPACLTIAALDRGAGAQRPNG